VCPGLAHRTVRCATGQCPVHQGTSRWTPHHRENPPDCPVPQGRAALELASLGNLLRYNSPAVRWASGATATSRQRSPAGAFNAHQKRAEVRHARAGTPDNLQYLSGVHRTARRAQKIEAPMVESQRPGDAAGAPDCLVHHRTVSLHQTASLVVGAINTPNHPTFKSSKFSHFNYLQEL
jgi:hypothetical protein